MEKAAETVFHGSKHSNLNKSFGQCLRFLLTAFPFEVFVRLNVDVLSISVFRLCRLFYESNSYCDRRAKVKFINRITVV